MLLAEPMSELSVVFLQQDEPKIIELASESGVLHAIQPQSVHSWTKDLKGEDAAVIERQFGAIAAKTRSLLQDLGVQPSQTPQKEPDAVQTAEQLQKSFNEISAPVRKIQARVESLNTEKHQVEILARQMHSPRPSEIAEAFAGPHSFLRVVFASGREANISTLQSRLEGVPSIVMPVAAHDDRATVLALVLRRDRAALEKAIHAAGFEPEDPSKLLAQHEISLEKVHEKTAEIDQELTLQKKNLSNWASENSARAVQIYHAARRGEMAARARSFVRATRHARFICGWVPTNKGKALVREIQQSTQGRAFADLVSADEVEGVRARRTDVPALFRNPGWMRPFEPLTTGFGIPTYRSVNPTPFLAVTFLFMFGMMFGDVGHGLVLALGGWFLTRRRATRNLGWVLLMAGCSSILFGFFYGSIFGLEHVIPAMLLHPMEEIETLAIIAIVFGVLMISLGVVLRVINALREGNWGEVVFDKSGLISGLLYWLILGLVCRSLWVSGSTLPTLGIIIAAGLMLAIVLKGPLMKVFKVRQEHESSSLPAQIFDGLFELYETLIGLLSNTISFVRLAAFALGHVGVSMGIYSLMDVIQHGAAGWIWRVTLVIVGNAGVILLEGLVVGIQTVRLEYFEFFCKFFNSGGLPYKPLSLEETQE